MDDPVDPSRPRRPGWRGWTQRASRRTSRVTAMVAITAVGAAALANFAMGTHRRDGVIKACYDRRTGDVSLIGNAGSDAHAPEERSHSRSAWKDHAGPRVP